MSTKILTITGPTCSGKSTLVKHLQETGKFQFILGFTTRAPRPGEVPGVDYLFLTKEEAQEKINNKETVESVEFNGNYYGVLHSEVARAEATGKIPMVILEPQGKEQFDEVFGERIHSLYLFAPLSVLCERFMARIKEEVLEKGEDFNEKYAAKRLNGMFEEFEGWGDNFFDDEVYCNENTISEIVKFLVEEL